MNPITCAITGANGYLGKYLVDSLRQQKYIVYELARSKESALLKEFFLPFSLNETTLPTLDNIDVLIHCAYDFSANTMQLSDTVNIGGSIRLLAHAKKSGVKKIIVISSMSAYPDARSVYGKTKLALEKKAMELNAIIIRPGLIFGKNTQGIVGAMQKFIKKFPIVPLIGNGQQEFYPCYLENLYQLIVQLMMIDSPISKPIIAASQNAITFKKIITLLAKSKNQKIMSIPIPFWLIWSGLKLLEMLNVNIDLRSDSLLGAQYYDKNPDFSELEKFDVAFREMDVSLL